LSNLQVAAEGHKLKILSIDAHREGGKGDGTAPPRQIFKKLVNKK
jgi:hypothetical protein